MSFKNTLKRGLLYLIIVGNTSVPSQAQFNILTGANFGSFNPEGVNAAIQNYNSTQANLTQELNEFKNWYGLNLGARYKYEMVAFNIGWVANFKRLETKNSNPDQEEKFNIKNTAVYLGPEFFFGSSPVSLGANISYDSFKIKYSLDGQKIDPLVLDEKGWNTQVYLSLNFGGEGFISMILRPYYTISLTEYDFSGFLNQINQSGSNNNYPLNQFGFSLIFANGPSY